MDDLARKVRKKIRKHHKEAAKRSHVVFGARNGISFSPADRRRSGEMEDDVWGKLPDPRDRAAIPDIFQNKAVLEKILWYNGVARVVDDEDLMAEFQKTPCGRRSDITQTACHHGFHGA